MSEDNKRIHADKVYNIVCEAIENEFPCEKDESKRQLTFDIRGYDIPMRFYVTVDEGRQLVKLLSSFPFRFKPDKIIDACVAACFVSEKLTDGCFAVGINDGALIYKQTLSVFKSEVSHETVLNLINTAYNTVDIFNDRFFLLARGKIPLEEFLSQ